MSAMRSGSLVAGQAAAPRQTPFLSPARCSAGPPQWRSSSQRAPVRAESSAARARGTPPPTPPVPPPPAALSRRQLLLHGGLAGQLIAAGAALADDGNDDARTLINSVLGAYGLPKLKATPGFKYYEDLDEPVVFQFPKAWVRRKNSMRPGLVISDFSTADKLSLEAFPEPPAAGGTAALAEAAVLKLINPAAEIGGDARLELPPASRIRTEQREVDGKVYTFISFPSETITRSGYQVRRKNMAVAAARKGTVYVLGCSARSDQFDAEKEAVFQTIVDSFRVL